MFFDFSKIMKLLPPPDKMKLIRILHSLYDLLGVLIPFTITGKLTLQLCSRLGLTWKAKLPDEILDVWQPWTEQIQDLNGYSFKRTIIQGEQPDKADKQLHIFADASNDAYAAVTYLRSKSNKVENVTFVQAKSRVRPVKAAHTIPRMELLAIELGLQLLKKIYTKFGLETYNLYIWTDS
jgi:hypothetical protein